MVSKVKGTEGVEFPDASGGSGGGVVNQVWTITEVQN